MSARLAYRVFYTEYERDWGSRVDGYKDFEGENAQERAMQHTLDFNSKNNLDIVPDWYMVASAPVLVDLNKK